MSDFERAVAHVLRFEGGYSDDKSDPGGETNFGISKRAHPTLDIKHLTKVEASAIYQRDYWTKNGCDTMAWPLSLIHFDTCVNLGAAKASGMLARSNGDAAKYLADRRAYYERLIAKKPALVKYRNGWLNRVHALETLATEA